MKTILVPVDFSEYSKRALEYSIHIAQMVNAKIILFHSFSPMMVASDNWENTLAVNAEEEMMVEINKKMDKFLSLAIAHKVETEKIVQVGLLGDLVSNIADDLKADLIITGMHSPNGLERMLGTNSVNIFHKVKIPVLIIPEKAKYEGIHKIIYATDFKYDDVEELKKVCEIASLFKADVVAVHVSTNPADALEDAETMDWFSMAGDNSISYERLSYRTIFNEDIVQGLGKAIGSSHASIVCLSTLKKSLWTRLTSASITSQMAYHTKIPLLAIHLRE